MDVSMQGPEPQQHAQAQPQPRMETAEEAHKHRVRYVVIFAGMIFLTVLAFLGIGLKVLPNSWLFPIILLFALCQVVLQVYLFMHLDVGRVMFKGFFTAAIGVALVVAIGILLLVWAY